MTDVGDTVHVVAFSFAALLVRLGKSLPGELADCGGPNDGLRCAACPIPVTPVVAGPCTFQQLGRAVQSLGEHAAAISDISEPCPDCDRLRAFDGLYKEWFHTDSGESSCDE